MKHGVNREEVRNRQADWILHEAYLARYNPPLLEFINRWAGAMETWLENNPRRHVRDIAGDALKRSGGFDLTRLEVSQAIRILDQCWQHGASLERWASNDSTRME